MRTIFYFLKCMNNFSLKTCIKFGFSNVNKTCKKICRKKFDASFVHVLQAKIYPNCLCIFYLTKIIYSFYTCFTSQMVWTLLCTLFVDSAQIYYFDVIDAQFEYKESVITIITRVPILESQDKWPCRLRWYCVWIRGAGFHQFPYAGPC